MNTFFEHIYTTSPRKSDFHAQMHRKSLKRLRMIFFSYSCAELESKFGNSSKKIDYLCCVRITCPTPIDDRLCFEVSALSVWEEPLTISGEKKERRSIRCGTRMTDHSCRETSEQHCWALLFANLWVSDTASRIRRVRELFVLRFLSSSVPRQTAFSCPRAQN